MHTTRTTFDKVVSKGSQRLWRHEKPAMGAAALSASVVEAWRHLDGALDGVSELPFLDGPTVRSIAAGRMAVNSATVAFLLNLDGASQALSAMPVR